MNKYDGKWASLNNGFDLTAYEVLQRASNVVNDEPANSSLSKVDSTLFNVEETEEDGVKVLKLTVKNGSTVKELKYDGKEIWSSGIFGSPCSSAVIYMNGDRPTLAVLVTRDNKNNKQGTVYRYHNGKKWKKGREGTHKSKLENLRAVPPQPTGPKEEDAKTPTTNKPDTEDSPVVQQNLYTPTQSPPSGQTANSDQKTTESAKRGQGVKVKPVESPVPTPKEEVSPQDNGTSKPVTDESQVTTTPITLDLTKPDETKLDVHTETKSEVTVKAYTPQEASSSSVKFSRENPTTPLQPTVVPAGQSTAEESPKPTAPVTLDLANPDKSKVEIREDLTGGVSYRGFVPKNIFHISSVTYGDKELWTASEGEEFTFAGSSTKENYTLISIVINGSDYGLDLKYFELVDGEWKNINEGDFFNKLEELSKQELSPTEEPTSPSQ
ncbi:hypothetical protein BEWA_049820 [Theileria equi strain WA]|uniref:Uncharacterized protein n=1 Tax=Theileria equi strain WA TaxID=1537102 RepID=L1LB63_THEEQ|nr:hypothetical protein BEWA_049820 [Theileria equi strain WA]EKX72515.1 hypothetical protein BEWA_049820 [Theileria equi strain WA]|eukprot:XP_004831967.1 hypothetical protein BEWA_049820 [Theileria equi strain WA]